MLQTPNTGKPSNPQKLFGSVGSELRGLLPVLAGVKVRVKKGKRHKPRKNSGLDHVMQCLTAKLCGRQSDYRMSGLKTPKTLRKKGIRFLEKSTHYDTVEYLDIDSIWQTNASVVQKRFALPEQLTVMLDSTPTRFDGKYEAKRFGYIGTKDGKPVTSECHQLFSASLAGFKQILYQLRVPGNYVAFSSPAEHGDRGLSGLDFDGTVAHHMVDKVHTLYPGKRFRWLKDRGFGDFGFLASLKERGDDFVTALDSNAECVKNAQRRIDSGSVVLKKSIGFDYYETIVHILDMNLKAVYIKPKNNNPPYWLVTTEHDLTGEEIKKLYNIRSGDEPVYDYLKNDFNAKKPCKKNFAGAQAYTALLCLVQNLMSLLSQHILGAYHRLPTVAAMIAEQGALGILFSPTPGRQSGGPPPIIIPTHPHAKNNR